MCKVEETYVLDPVIWTGMDESVEEFVMVVRVLHDPMPRNDKLGRPSRLYTTPFSQLLQSSRPQQRSQTIETYKLSFRRTQLSYKNVINLPQDRVIAIPPLIKSTSTLHHRAEMKEPSTTVDEL